MPVVTSGLLEFTLRQSYGGENSANVFYYWNSLGTEPSSFVALLLDFENSVQAVQRAVQSNINFYTEIIAKTIFGTLPDAVKIPVAGTGAKTGLGMPNYVAAGFRLQGDTKETRPGAKRVGGLTEDDVQANIFEAAFVTQLEVVATAFEDSLTNGIDVWEPCIYGRPTPTRATHIANPVAAVTVNTFVSSQVSRKRG